MTQPYCIELNGFAHCTNTITYPQTHKEKHSHTHTHTYEKCTWGNETGELCKSENEMQCVAFSQNIKLNEIDAYESKMD